MTKALKRVFKMSYRDICFGLQTGACFVEDVIHSENVNLTVKKPDGSEVAKLCLGSTLCRR